MMDIEELKDLIVCLFQDLRKTTPVVQPLEGSVSTNIINHFEVPVTFGDEAHFFPDRWSRIFANPILAGWTERSSILRPGQLERVDEQLAFRHLRFFIMLSGSKKGQSARLDVGALNVWLHTLLRGFSCRWICQDAMQEEFSLLDLDCKNHEYSGRDKFFGAFYDAYTAAGNAPSEFPFIYYVCETQQLGPTKTGVLLPGRTVSLTMEIENKELQQLVNSFLKKGEIHIRVMAQFESLREVSWG